MHQIIRKLIHLPHMFFQTISSFPKIISLILELFQLRHRLREFLEMMEKFVSYSKISIFPQNNHNNSSTNHHHNHSSSATSSDLIRPIPANSSRNEHTIRSRGISASIILWPRWCTLRRCQLRRISNILQQSLQPLSICRSECRKSIHWTIQQRRASLSAIHDRFCDIPVHSHLNNSNSTSSSSTK